MISTTASSLSIGSLRRTVLIVGLATLITSLPLGWLVLARVSTLTLRPMHLFIPLLLIGCVSTDLWRLRIARLNWGLLAVAGAYCLLLAAGAVSMLPAGNFSGGLVKLVKAMAYLSCFVITTVAVRRILEGSPETLASIVLLGCMLGTLLFAGTATYVFARQGRNLAVEYLATLRMGDTDAVYRGFYPQLFTYANAGDTPLQRDSDDYVQTNLRHTIVGTFILYFILLQAFLGGADRHGSRRVLTRLLQAVAVFIVITSISRSLIASLVLVVGGMVILECWPPRPLRVTARRLSLLLAISAAAAACVAFTYNGYLEGIGSVLRDRFSDLSENARIVQFQDACRAIADRPWLGHGFAARLDNLNASRIHNLILSAWFEAGVWGFFAAVLLFLAILWLWGAAVVRFVRTQGRGKAALNPAILMLPVLPLMRSMMSGEGGHFAFVEWSCLAFFVAAAGANKTGLRGSLSQACGLRRAQSSRPTSPGGRGDDEGQPLAPKLQ